MRKLWVAALCAAGLLGLASHAAAADVITIDFGQFGPAGATFGPTLTGVTNTGVGFTITDSGAGFERVDQGPGGPYNPGTPLLISADGDTVTFNFDSPILGLAITIGSFSPTDWGANESLFNSSLPVGGGNGGCCIVPGGLAEIHVGGTPFDKSVLTFSDASGFSLGANQTFFGASVPEPASWALLITGFGMAGGALRRRRAVPA